MNDLGAVGLPAPFHALFDPYTTPQGNSSDRRPSKNRLLAILQIAARTSTLFSGYMRESEANARGRVARSHVTPLPHDNSGGLVTVYSKNACTERFLTTGEKSFHIQPNIPKELTQYLELWGNSCYVWFMKQLRRRLTKAFYLLLHSLQ